MRLTRRSALTAGAVSLLPDIRAAEPTRILLPYPKTSVSYSLYSSVLLGNSSFRLEVVDRIQLAYDRTKAEPVLFAGSSFHEYPLLALGSPVILHGAVDRSEFILAANPAFAARTKDWRNIQGARIGVFGVAGRTAGSPLFFRQLGAKNYASCRIDISPSYSSFLSGLSSGDLDMAWTLKSTVLSAIANGRIQAIASSGTSKDERLGSAMPLEKLLPGSAPFYSFNYLAGRPELKPAAEELLKEFSNSKHDYLFKKLSSEREILNGSEALALYRKQLKDFSWSHFSI